VSLKGRLRRLDAGVRWLETEGDFLRFKGWVEYLEKVQEIADRAAVDPEFAAKWERDFSYVPLPPPRVGVRPPARKPIVAPRPVVVPPLPEGEQRLPVAAPAPAAVIEAPLPLPRPPPVMSAPMPGMPVSPPSPDMEIRPVRWRERGPQDYYDDAAEEEVDGTNGRCLTEYDVLRDDDD
jgi:hypothetical protein